MIIKKNKVSHSYGIICCKYNHLTKKNEILFIKKKNTYAYISFIKGIYNSDYDIKLLFDKMTLDEKLTILSLDFKVIWYKCYLKYDIDSDNKLKKYKKKFDKLKSKENYKYFYNIIKKSSSVDLLFEIPKGHANKNESIINAAIREFHEETHIPKNKYKILYDVKPFIYSFTDENVNYIYTYYIAIMLDNKYIPQIHFDNKFMLFETSDIKFLPIEYVFVINNDIKFLTMLKNVLKTIKKFKIKNYI